jgi:hypothetical protein
VHSFFRRNNRHFFVRNLISITTTTTTPSPILVTIFKRLDERLDAAQTAQCHSHSAIPLHEQTPCKPQEMATHEHARITQKVRSDGTQSNQSNKKTA